MIPENQKPHFCLKWGFRNQCRVPYFVAYGVATVNVAVPTTLL